ncbi:MAG: hypothetical protein JXB50_10820 [Spirochaetes bacterium]|nr:hypothetical protein [Spirochaetota bacterium]
MFLSYNSSTDKWEKTEGLYPYDSELGQWMLNNITLQDKRGNIRRYERISEQSLTNYCDLKSVPQATPFAFAEIEVTPPPSDNIAPFMSGISVDETDTTTTRDIVISNDADDDLSCVKSVICRVESPTEQSNPGTGGDFKDIYLSCIESASMWQGNVSFQYGAETGEWMINNIVIEDYAGNIKSYERRSESSTTHYYDVNNSTVTSFLYILINVTESEDITAPYMEGIYVNPIDTGTTRDIIIMIEAFDGFSGITSVSCVVESPDEQFYGGGTYPLINVSLTYNSNESLWEGLASIPVGAQLGQWMINNIVIEDAAGNSRLYDRNSAHSETYYYDETDLILTPFEFVTIDVIN